MSLACSLTTREEAGSQSCAFRTDPLTGLENRDSLREKLGLLVRERSFDPAPFTLGIVNLDGFKPINDLFGSDAGDEILRQVADRLRACVPDGVSVTRIDADEFGLILPLIFEKSSARRMGQMIRDVLSAPYAVGDRSVRLSASLGFSVYPFAGLSFDELMRNAETALYRSKRRGRGQITVYSREIAEEMRRSTQIEQALRTAVMADAVDVHFQPIVPIAKGGVAGFEALARWNDADLGHISPAVFVPLAEERGFIDMLSQALLRKAAEAALSWPRELFLSFNLSSAQLTDPSTGIRLLSTLADVGLDPSRLELEITETAMISCPDTARRIIADVQREGVRVALDDFGTGHSSLGRLREFSFDKIKIDRAFISRLAGDAVTEEIVRAIIVMSRGLDLEVVAEGIETREDAEKLRELGCAMGQGYYFGRPGDRIVTQRYLDDRWRDFVNTVTL